jgi:hypothetical protein
MQYEQLVEFKRINGHCMVPNRHEEDKSLGRWVSDQRKYHSNDTIRQDRKIILDEIGFVWSVEKVTNTNDAAWHQQHEKLVGFKRKYGHCMVPARYEQDKSLGIWVSAQRRFHNNNKLRLDRKRILDEVGFFWNRRALPARASSADVRGLVIGSFHALGRSHVSHSRSFSAYFCRIRIRKLSLAVHQKDRNLPKVALETNVHLPPESDQVPALSKPDKCPLLVAGQNKEAMLKLVPVLRRQIVVSMKKLQARLP